MRRLKERDLILYAIQSSLYVERATWFRHPMQSRITARRFAARSVRHQFQDFAPQSQSAVDWLNQELKRPNSAAHHRTVTIAGMPYHWTQTYDGVLRLAPGASPW